LIATTNRSPQHVCKFIIADSEKMRLDANGNVGVGTTTIFSPGGADASVVQLTGVRYPQYISQATAGATDEKVWRTIVRNGTTYEIQALNDAADAETDAIKITRSGMTISTIYLAGNVGIGTTAPGVKLHIEHSTDRQAIRMRDTGAPAGEYWNFGPDQNNAIVLENDNNVGVYIADGGNSWSGLSDERLKTNVQPLNVTSGLEAIMRLDAVTFDWRFGQRSDTNIGLIAQNVRDVFPSLISTTSTRTFHLDDGTEEEITDPLGVEYTGLIVPLIKATQELKATIDAQATLIASLETRITTLEG
jgi:hypothetical protein